jgi:putative tricarboxylic transport membrane protein
MKIKIDQIIGIFLVLCGIAVSLLISRFSVAMTPQYPGPKLLPAIAAFGFIVCGSGIFVQSTMSKKEEKAVLLSRGWLKIVLCFSILCLYILLMKFAGFLIATPILLYIISTLFAKGYVCSRHGRLIFSLAVTGIIYVVYIYAFGLGLPRGILFQ